MNKRGSRVNILDTRLRMANLERELQERISEASFAAEEPKLTADQRKLCDGFAMLVHEDCFHEYSVAQHEGPSCAAPASIDRADVLAMVVRPLTARYGLGRKDNDAGWDLVEGQGMGRDGALTWLSVYPWLLKGVVWRLVHHDTQPLSIA